MNKENYEIMKKFILSFAEEWNCPNDILESITGFSWMQYHDLRRRLVEE